MRSEGDAVSPSTKDVDSYIAAAAPEAVPRLHELREAIKAAAPDAEEMISYQIPSYKLHGYLVGFAANKTHCGLYAITEDVLGAFADEVKPYLRSKNTLGFQLTEPVPVDLVKRLVAARVAENEAAAAAKATRSRARRSR
jgi:uncharacterized protein YdhG (YjbR/CyaY superfamily)